MTEIFEFERPDGSVIEIEAPSRDAAIKAWNSMRAAPERAPSGFMAFVNRGIADIYGGPVTEEGMRRALGAGSVPRPGETAETLMQRAGYTMGQGAAMLLPIGAAGRIAQGLNTVAGGAARTLAAPFVRAPVGATATELAASAAAGPGGMIGERVAPEGYEDLGRGLGEIGGAAIGGATAEIADATRRALSPSALYGMARGALTPFTRAGAEVRAARRLQELSADPEAQAAAIADPGIADLSPAQRTGDPRLMALERTVLEGDPALADQFEQRARAAAQTLRREAVAPAEGRTGADLRAFADQRRGEFMARLNTRITDAMARAETRVARLSPERRATENSIIVREELDRAYEAARGEEDRLWRAVPKDTIVETGGLRSRFDQISEETPTAQRADIPDIARRLLADDEAWGVRQSINEVHGLYSELRRIQRAASAGAAPNRNMARIAGELADAALEDMNAFAGTRDVDGRMVRQALDYTAGMHETFTRGAVGRTLGLRREGGPDVPPERTLERAFGSTDATAVAAERQFTAAMGEGAGREAAADFLRGRFMDAAAPRGTFDPARARDFLRRNLELLDRFPQLRDEIRAAVMDADAGAIVLNRMRQRGEALADPSRSAGAALGRTRFGEEFNAILTARDPARTAKSLRALAAKDETGAALGGLKGAALDHLMGRAATGAFDAQGGQFVSGRAILGMLDDGRTASAVREILNPGEISRLRRIAGELSKLETARGRLPNVGPIMDDTPSAILAIPLRVLAARTGGRVGSQGGGGMAGGLQTAQMFSGRVKTFLENITADRAELLIREAITNPQLFRDLLTKPTPRNAWRLNASLDSWLASLTVDSEQEAQ